MNPLESVYLLRKNLCAKNARLCAADNTTEKSKLNGVKLIVKSITNICVNGAKKTRSNGKKSKDAPTKRTAKKEGFS